MMFRPFEPGCVVETIPLLIQCFCLLQVPLRPVAGEAVSSSAISSPLEIVGGYQTRSFRVGVATFVDVIVRKDAVDDRTEVYMEENDDTPCVHMRKYINI